MTFGILDVFGFFGVGAYVLGYGLLLTGYIRGHSYTYALFNVAGSGLTLISLIGAFNLYSAMIQLLFLTFSVVGMVRVFLIMRRLRFDRDERRFLATKGRNLSRVSARRLFDHGHWRQLSAGTALTRQGEQVGGLYFISSGTAKAAADGAQLGRLRGGDFVGELTCLNDLPATATVTATSPVRVFFIARDRLESVMNADAEINAHLLVSMRNDVTRKLVRVNDRLTEIDAALKR